MSERIEAATAKWYDNNTSEVELWGDLPEVDKAVVVDNANLAPVLAAADAADHETGIVRVDTRDEATVEKVARAICAAQFPTASPVYAWTVQFEDGQDEYRDQARAALAALEDQEGK
jgi:hypothetical protein